MSATEPLEPAHEGADAPAHEGEHAPVERPVAPASDIASPPPDVVLKKTVMLTAGVAAGFTLAGAAIAGPWWAVGTFIGGVLATLNLVLFIRLGRALLAQQATKGARGVLGALKLVGLLVCVFIIVRQDKISPIAFVLGYGSLPIAISLSSFFRRKEEADPKAG